MHLEFLAVIYIFQKNTDDSGVCVCVCVCICVYVKLPTPSWPQPARMQVSHFSRAHLL